MVDLKQSDFKIFKVEEYREKGQLRDGHFIVKQFRSTWWSFGKRWLTERYYNGECSNVIEFSTFEEAQNYIERKVNGRPMQTTIIKEITVPCPGRCVLIDRSEESSIFVDKKLVKMWKEDPESLLYAYNDIQPLSGSAGYILKLKNGKIFEQVTIRS